MMLYSKERHATMIGKVLLLHWSQLAQLHNVVVCFKHTFGIS